MSLWNLGNRDTSTESSDAESPAPVCPQCGYDLRQIPEVACPECGFGYQHAAIEKLALAVAVTDEGRLDTTTTLATVASAMACPAMLAIILPVYAFVRWQSLLAATAAFALGLRVVSVFYGPKAYRGPLRTFFPTTAVRSWMLAIAVLLLCGAMIRLLTRREDTELPYLSAALSPNVELAIRRRRYFCTAMLLIATGSIVASASGLL